MTDLDDLRATLDQHAEGAVRTSTTTTSARTAAVRGRVNAVRRRRRTVAIAGTAAAVAAVTGVVLVPGGQREAGPEPATTVVGLTPPASLSALDFDYELTDGIEGEGSRVRVDLPVADVPRLVSWATSGDDDRVTLRGPALGEGRDYDVADFTDWYYVAPGADLDLTVVAVSGTPGAAVYTLGDERPAGLTTQGVTFREAPAGLQLLGGAVGEPGAAEVTVPAEALTQGISLVADCSGAGRDVWLQVEIAGSEAFGSGPGCTGELPVDAATGGTFGYPTEPGEDVTARLYVTEGRNGPPVSDPDLRLSLGVYARTDTATINSVDAAFPPVIERDGHRWQRVSRLDGFVGRDGRRQLADAAPAGDRPVLAQLWVDVRRSAVRVRIDDRPSTTRLARGVTGGPTELVAPGATVRLSVRGPLSADDRVAVGFYEQAD